MACATHGELSFPSSSMGQVCDLIAILVSNGYTVEVRPGVSRDKVIVVIMKEF